MFFHYTIKSELQWGCRRTRLLSAEVVERYKKNVGFVTPFVVLSNSAHIANKSSNFLHLSQHQYHHHFTALWFAIHHFNTLSLNNLHTFRIPWYPLRIPCQYACFPGWFFVSVIESFVCFFTCFFAVRFFPNDLAFFFAPKSLCTCTF